MNLSVMGIQGYLPELHGEYRNETSPLITVYMNNGNSVRPKHSLGVRGNNRRLAWYFTSSFQGVVSLIKLLEPLSKNRSWVRGELVWGEILAQSLESYKRMVD